MAGRYSMDYVALTARAKERLIAVFLLTVYVIAIFAAYVLGGVGVAVLWQMSLSIWIVIWLDTSRELRTGIAG